MKDMKHSKYIVQLTDRERKTLGALIRKGRNPSRVLTRARILLKSDGGMTDAVIAQQLDVSERAVERTRQRYVQGGLARAP